MNKIITLLNPELISFFNDTPIKKCYSVVMKNSILNKSSINSRNLKKVSTLLNYCKYGNCWGTTLFLLGQTKNLRAVESLTMDSFLQKKTKLIKKPKIGDILVLRYKNKKIAKRVEDNSYEESLEANLLSHTALYIGKGQYIHQAGYCGPFRRDSLQGVLNIYDECKIEYARFMPTKKKTNKKKSKTKGKK